MNPNLSANEHKIREAIRGLRSTIEERDWQQMSALLDNAGERAPADTVPDTFEPPGESGTRRYWLLLLLLGISCFCYCIYGLRSLGFITSQSEKGHRTGEHQHSVTSDAAPSTAADTNKSLSASNNIPGENSDDPLQVFITDKVFQFPVISGTRNSPASVTPFSNSGTVQATVSTSDRRRENLLSNLEDVGKQKEIIGEERGKSASTVTPSMYTNSEKITASAIPGINGGGNASGKDGIGGIPVESTQRISTILPPVASVEQLRSESYSKDTFSIEPLLLMDKVAAAAIIPGLSLNWPLTHTVHQPALDSMVKPQPVGRFRSIQRGWIVGGNVTLVDFPDRQFNALPHFGYHYSMYLSPGYRLQTELQVKYVNHYSEKSEYKTFIPGGSTEVILNLKDLFFIELPVLIKKSAPDYSSAWLFGVSPSWCKPLSQSGLYAISGSGPNVNIRMEDGLQRFDIRFIVGREWRFSPRWGIDIRYGQGIFDLTHDNFFKNNTTHLHADIQITFRHYVKPYKNKRD
jgi:hypothetical protein